MTTLSVDYQLTTKYIQYNVCQLAVNWPCMVYFPSALHKITTLGTVEFVV